MADGLKGASHQVKARNHDKLDRGLTEVDSGIGWNWHDLGYLGWVRIDESNDMEYLD